MVDLHPLTASYGPGTWDLNPLILTHSAFHDLLTETIILFANRPATANPQDAWDKLKLVIKGTAFHYSQRLGSQRRTELRDLQRRRTQLMKQSPANASSAELLEVKQHITTLIEEQTKQLLLRTNTRWHEQGERNNKYFFRVLKSRQAACSIQ